MLLMSCGAPEVGQLVRVRDRHWVVSEVVGINVCRRVDAASC